MHVVFRLFFWLTLAGTVLSLAAPSLTSAAAWDEAQPVAILGLVMTTVFAWASARALPASVAADPFQPRSGLRPSFGPAPACPSSSLVPRDDDWPVRFAAAKRRKSSGIAYAIVMMVVLGPMSLVALNEAQQDVRHAEGEAADERERAERYGYASPYSNAQDEIAEAEAGLVTSYVGLGVVGLALVGLIAAASRRLPQQPAAQTMFHTAGRPYQPVVMAPYEQPHPQYGWNEQTFG